MFTHKSQFYAASRRHAHPQAWYIEHRDKYMRPLQVSMQMKETTGGTTPAGHNSRKHVCYLTFRIHARCCQLME